MIKKLLFTFLTVFYFSGMHAQSLSATLNDLADHISGSSTMSAAELTASKEALLTFSSDFESDEDAIELAFEVIANHDAKYGALFTNESSTSGGIKPRTSSGYDLENAMFTLMQSVLDYSYTQENLEDYPSIFNNVKFDTSDNFPGAVSQPSNANVSYTIKLNADHIKVAGVPSSGEASDARRPTGCYLAPGSVATVTVPSSLVGIGATILVGAHTWDNEARPNSLRLDRVTKLYEITSTEVTIGNPLGGGIYINVPFESRLGVVNITLENVVRSPYFANTPANQTSLSDWKNTQRNYSAPWTDFETEKVMIQVPTSWIYAMDDPESILADWDLALDAVSDFLGRPHVRAKTHLYAQVDLQFRGSAFFPGYPQANTTYDPNTDYGGNYDNYLIEGPKNNSSSIMATLFHELGHGEHVYKFTGEIEAIVNFLYVPVYNKAFGVDLDTAFSKSASSGLIHTLDDAAISWMIAENFRLGNPMSSTTGEYRQEFAYQPRGYAKYTEVVRLFGWEAIEKFNQNYSDEYDNGDIPSTINSMPTDERILDMSIAAGADLRPLLHFWGIHPLDAEQLATDIDALDLKPSDKIKEALEHYKTIVPMSNEAFRDFGLNDYSESTITDFNLLYESNVDQSYYAGFFKKFWDIYGQEEGQAAQDQVQAIIDLYFDENDDDDDDDDDDDTQSFTPDPNKTYYLEVPTHDLRVAATGDDNDPYTTSNTTTGADVEWKFIANGNGYWHIQRAAGGSKPRLRTDNSLFADMQFESHSGSWSYYRFDEGATADTHYITLPNGPEEFQRLQMTSAGEMKFVATSRRGTWASWKITEVSSDDNDNEEEVTIYQHCNYNGTSISLGIGEYADLVNEGFLNNYLSSLEVPTGLTVTLFSETNFGGTSMTFTSDGDCLANDGFNDEASSIKIEETGIITLGLQADETEIISTIVDETLIYPNPSSEYVNIYTPDGIDIEEVHIYSLSRIIESHEINYGLIQNNTLSIDTSHLESGIYSIQLDLVGGASEMHQLVVKHE